MGRLSPVYLLVITSLDQLLIVLVIILIFCTKSATLMRRSIVLNLSHQLVFPAECFVMHRITQKCQAPELISLVTIADVFDSDNISNFDRVN